MQQSGRLQGADWTAAADKAVFTAAAIKIQLASRAKKAKRKVEERRLRNLEIQQQQAEADKEDAFEQVLHGEDYELLSVQHHG